MATETKAQRERRESSERLQAMQREMLRPAFKLQMAWDIPKAYAGAVIAMAVEQGIITSEQSGKLHQLMREDEATPLQYR